MRRIREPAILATLGLLLYPLTRLRIYAYEHDGSAYIGTAQSLAAGRGYQFNGVPQTVFPPGLPLLLSPVATASAATQHLVIALCGVLGLVLSWAWLSRREARWAFPLALLILTNAVYYRLAAGSILAEVPFLVVCLGLLLWMDRAMASGRPSWLSVAAGVTLLVGALTFRSLGVALVGAAALTLATGLVRRRLATRQAAALGVLLAAGAAWTLWWMSWTAQRVTVEYPGEYANHYGTQMKLVNPEYPDSGMVTPAGAMARLPRHAVRRALDVTGLLGNVEYLPAILALPAVGFALLLGLGWWQEVAGPAPFAAWYAFCLLGILLLWPFGEGDRLLLPLLPMLLLYLVRGVRLVRDVTVRWLGASALAPWWPRAAWAGMALVAVMGVRHIRAEGGANLRAEVATGPHASVHYASLWLREHLLPGQLVIAEDQAPLALMTGHRVIRLPPTGRAAVLREAVEHWRPAYVVINDSIPYPFLRPQEEERLAILQQAMPGRLREVERHAGGRIYAFDADSLMASPDRPAPVHR